jgi:hypothetical protein
VFGGNVYVPHSGILVLHCLKRSMYNQWWLNLYYRITRIMCRPQWPRGLRHEMSSPAWTLGSWLRIPLDAWMFVCVYSVFVLSCVGSGLATGWSLVQGVLPTVYKCKITEPHKEEAKARYGLQRHIRRRRIMWQQLKQWINRECFCFSGKEVLPHI